ncbi:hypothetical protein D3C85_1404700 [compost metagenome]
MCRITVLPALCAWRAKSVACGVSGMIAMVTGPGRAKVRLSRSLLWPRSSMMMLM